MITLNEALPIILEWLCDSLLDGHKYKWREGSVCSGSKWRCEHGFYFEHSVPIPAASAELMVLVLERLAKFPYGFTEPLVDMRLGVEAEGYFCDILAEPDDDNRASTTGIHETIPGATLIAVAQWLQENGKGF